MKNQNAKFNIGDAVTWMHVTRNGNRMGFKTKEGRISEFRCAGAIVKDRSGRKHEVHFDDLRLESEKTGVSEVFEAMAKQADPTWTPPAQPT